VALISVNLRRNPLLFARDPRRNRYQSFRQVGYESEAAFNRAFKRGFTVRPALFRSQSRSAQAKLPRQEKSRLVPQDQ
jgi:hypothetical protein